MKLFYLFTFALASLARADFTMLIDGDKCDLETVLKALPNVVSATITDTRMPNDETTLTFADNISDEYNWRHLRGADEVQDARNLNRGNQCPGGTIASCINNGVNQWLCWMFCPGRRNLAHQISSTAIPLSEKIKEVNEIENFLKADDSIPDTCEPLIFVQ